MNKDTNIIRTKLLERIKLIDLLFSLKTQPRSNSTEDKLLANEYQRGSDSRLKSEKKFVEKLLNDIDALK